MRIPERCELWSSSVCLLITSLPVLLLCSCAPRDHSSEAAVQVREVDTLKADTTGVSTAVPASPAPTNTAAAEAVPIDWKLLATTEFEDRYNEEFKAMIPYPIFPAALKKLEGETVQIKGYVIPVEETGEEGGLLVLSAVPYSQCFFCGLAGPESVMDVQLKEDLGRFDSWMDRQLTFRGRLRLNDSDLYYLNFILEEAKLINTES